MKTYHRWTEPEIARVEFLAGNTPFMKFEVRYNRWAEAHGYPARTLKAIRNLCCCQGISMVPHAECVTTAYVAELLEIPLKTVWEWKRRNLLPFIQATRRSTVYYRRSDLLQLAIARPHLFAGVSYNRLFALIENEKVARAICDQYPTRDANLAFIKPRSPVRCVEMNRIFNSISEAARVVYVRPQVISKAIKHGRRAGGYRWEYAK